MSAPTREALLAICERAFVPESKWLNRDSAQAQRQLGECYALLRAGCAFEMRDDMGGPPGTYWVRIYSQGFNAFESFGSSISDRENYDEETYYLPTEKRLGERADGDWY